eukprot:scaffold5045_cov127-Isochrysis_galbana.AAC.2
MTNVVYLSKAIFSFSRDGSALAPPSYASALTTGDFLAVPPSPKRPREDEQPEVAVCLVLTHDVVWGTRM